MTQNNIISAVMGEILAVVEQNVDELPKPDLINPSPFKKPILPHERFKF